MKPTDTLGDILIAGTWLQLRDAKGGDDFTGLLLGPVMLKNQKISETNCQVHVWNPITSETLPAASSQIVKVLGRVQFPLPDRTAHLRVDPTQIVKR